VADAPAYTTVPGKLPDLLKKIRESGVPQKVNKPWLDSMGFKSSNDRSMVAVLRQIGFIDASGVPTPAWKEFRGADSKGVLGRALRVGYEDLFQTYPDAPERPTTDLGHVFSTRTDAGKQAVDKMVSTFKTLAGLAEFTHDDLPAAAGPAVIREGTPPAATVVTKTATKGAGLTVNINVELTLPETQDEKVYQAFFKAMRQHLLSDDSL
jgi:hypothetical protein